MKKLVHLFEERLNPILWWLLAVGGWALSRVTQIWLDGYYARSQFPVPFYEGQTTFNAATLKGYYAHMMHQGTLDIYLQTQLIDYVFMFTSWIFLLLLAGASLRALPEKWREGAMGKWARAMLWIIPAAPLFDALENGVSFVMLSDPQGFAGWLVYPYSTFAVLKFALFAVGYLWAIFCMMGAAGYCFLVSSKTWWKTYARPMGRF